MDMMLPEANSLGARHIREAVPGAPCKPGDVLRVAGACDDQGREAGVDRHAGELATVEYLEYECGSGQHYPDDPMVGVRFVRSSGDFGEVLELWREEFVLVDAGEPARPFPGDPATEAFQARLNQWYDVDVANSLE